MSSGSRGSSWLVRYHRLIAWAAVIAVLSGGYSACTETAPTFPTTHRSLVFGVARLGFMLFFLVLFNLSRRRKEREPSGARSNQEGLALLQRGRVREALEKFQLAATQLDSAEIAHFNVGVARLNLWELEAAVAAFEQAQAGQGKVPPPVLLALAHALLGHRDEAERLVAGLAGESTGTGHLVRAVLAARAGDLSRASELASAVEVKQLGGMNRALAETLRAWAQQQRGKRWPVDRVALFGEGDARELQRTWPELAVFVDQASV